MDFLANRTWRELRAVARAHEMRFNNNLTRVEAHHFLRTALLESGRLSRVVSKLDDSEREALMTLKAAEGTLVRSRFTRVYGDIRLYRPWHDDAPIDPWRHPISIAEKLWFLGLIETDEHRFIHLSPEVAALLPSLSHPQTAVWEGQTDSLDAARIVRDVAVFLGTLLYQPVRLIHGRWLPPYTIQAINRSLSAPETLINVRSEFQCAEVRFLHYIAQAAGLIQHNDGCIQPAVEAWHWLSLPYAEAHNHLVKAITSDLQRHEPLWTLFRLPPVGVDVWAYLLELPAGTYTVGSLGDVLRLRALLPDASTRIRAALFGPLRQLGIGTVENAAVRLQTPVFEAAASAKLHDFPDAIGMTLPAAPACHALARLMAFATLDDAGLRINQQAVTRAVEAGHDAAAIAQILVALSGNPLSPNMMQCLEAWERAAHRVQMKPMLVLETADTQVMCKIRADWRMRPFIGTQLSPRHFVVRDEHELKKRLARRGFAMPDTRLVNPRAGRSNNDSDPAYSWIALRICQALSGIIPSPIHFPGAASRALEPTGQERAHYQHAVDQYVDQIRTALRGKVEGRPLLTQPDPAYIRSAIETALALERPVRIRYYSPASGDETERTIEPQLMYQRNGATYIEAWCNLDDASRTFRLDRILAIL